MAMASVVSIRYAICFLLVQMIAINAAAEETSVKYDNTTNFAYKINSGRSKRSLYNRMPVQLKVRVRYTTEFEIDLNLVRVPNFLANQHLPVYLSPHRLDYNVMRAVGEFVLYHDLEACSSVAYFELTNSLMGHIGVNYIIRELPFNFDAEGNYNGIAEARYVTGGVATHDPVQRVEILPLHIPPNIEEDSDNSQHHRSDTSIKRPSDTDPGPSTKRQKLEQTQANEIGSKGGPYRWNPLSRVYYLEILVFISPDVADMFKNYYPNNSHTEWVVKYCIRYFNAVDSMFQKIRIRSDSVKLRMNIAKVVILDNSKLLDSTNNGEIYFAETVAKLRKHFSENPRDYTPDSFDHVFMITSHHIIHNSVRVLGMTDYSTNLYEKREEGRFYDAIPVTIVEYGSRYDPAVREIGRTLNIANGPSLEMMERTGQCANIMQEGNFVCDRCWKWSGANKLQFETFFRENYNRCFMMNQPRSLSQPGPRLVLTPNAQCQCFGYDSHFMLHKHQNYVKVSECRSALQCVALIEGNSYTKYILPPFDGTPCGNQQKVCWNGECVRRVDLRCT